MYIYYVQIYTIYYGSNLVVYYNKNKHTHKTTHSYLVRTDLIQNHNPFRN